MLYIAHGTIETPLDESERLAHAAWFGPMVDAGFLQAAYIDSSRHNVFMVIAAPDETDVRDRLAMLPAVRNDEISFEVHPVTALRYS